MKIKQSHSPQPVAALPINNSYGYDYPTNMGYASYTSSTTEAMSPTTMHAPIPRSDGRGLQGGWNFGPYASATGMGKVEEQEDQKGLLMGR